MRKSLGKKIRFEVFKRDAFTCQYCGRKAPEVVLRADHIKPVCAGGEDDILNLITACFDCNAGKGPLELDDNSIIEKQRQQLEDLNERRIQLEMMLEWREHMRGLDDAQIDAFCADFARLVDGYSVNELGRQDIKKWLKRFSLEMLLISLEASASAYLKRRVDETVDPSCITKVFTYVPRIAHVKSNGDMDPVKRQLFYIRGIVRNRMYVNERMIMPLLEAVYVVGCDLEALTNFAKTARNWTAFRTGIEQYIADVRKQQGVAENDQQK